MSLTPENEVIRGQPSSAIPMGMDFENASPHVVSTVSLDKDGSGR
jgi:hypothetical protein